MGLREQVLVISEAPKEYQVVDGPEYRVKGKEPTSPWSYPARGLAAWGHQRNAQVVLPDVAPIQTFASGLHRIWQELDIADPTKLSSPIWVEDPLIGARDALTHVILTDLDGFAQQVLRDSSRSKLIPHAYTPEIAQLKERLQTDYEIKLDVSMDQKPYQYPNIFDRSGFAPFARRYNLPVPYSVIAVGEEEMVSAYQQVADQSQEKLVWAKLAASGGGYGVVPVNNPEEIAALYQHFRSLGILNLYGREIPWEIQANVKNIAALGSWQYQGNKITTPGEFCLQYMDPNDPTVWIGNGYYLWNGLDKDVTLPKTRKLQKQTMFALSQEKGLNHNFAGGFDFPITESGDVLILEHNGARMSDATLQSNTAKAFGIGSRKTPFIAIKLGSPNADINVVWRFLKANDFAYNPSTGEGLAPFAWIKDQKAGYATVIISAADADRLSRLHSSAIESMRKEGLIK